jgi:signal transduction histidine kinase
MKRSVLIALAAFALAGCAKESVVDSALTNAGNAIGFNTYSNITRGNPFDNNPEFAASGNVFGVTAFISTSDSPYMGKADAGTSRILQAIYDESVRLSQTVNDFLDYARPRQPRQDLVDLDLVLSQVLAFLEGELGRVGVAVERATSPGLWVRGDKDLLYRAIYNILVNGQQAMDGPGIIRISSRMSDDGRVVLEALDSGPGFDPALLDSVLDPFFTTKDGGTGLGLPIVSSIINSHGGEIQLANGPEGGALVRILLPAAEPEHPEEPEVPAAVPAPAEVQPAVEESGETAAQPADEKENGTPEPRKES